MTARFIVGDVLEVLPTLEASSVDLVLTSPPFLALRSYLPADHPDKSKEGGSQPTPGAFIDWLVDVVEALDRVLAPHGSMVIELGDTYAGSGGAGGDYNEKGWRDGQEQFDGSALRTRQGGSGDFVERRDDDPTAVGARVGSARFRQGYDRRDGRITMQREDYQAPLPVAKGAGSGWPASKSLTLIPELFRMTLVYGFNPLTGRQTKRWRLRNVIRWVRPNPPVGALGDKFRPATSELMVFCRTDEAGRRRYFDLDAVREPNINPKTTRVFTESTAHSLTKGNTTQLGDTMHNNPVGSPPLDWWNIPPRRFQWSPLRRFP